MKETNEARIEKFLLIIFIIAIPILYFSLDFLSELPQLLFSIISSGNPVTNLNIIFITISIIIIVEFVRFLVFYIKGIINDPFPYGMYYSNSSDDD